MFTLLRQYYTPLYSHVRRLYSALIFGAVTVICAPSEICFPLNKSPAIRAELPVVLHPDAVAIICVSSEICFPSSKVPFPQIARINSQAHCEYFQPISMLESLF